MHCGSGVLEKKHPWGLRAPCSIWLDCWECGILEDRCIFNGSLWESPPPPLRTVRFGWGSHGPSQSLGEAQLLSLPAPPWTWDRLVPLLPSHTCSTPVPRMLLSLECCSGILAGCPGCCRAAVGNDPVVLWVWVWVERDSALMPACSQERESSFLGERSLFFYQVLAPLEGITTLLKHHLIPAKTSRLGQHENWGNKEDEFQVASWGSLLVPQDAQRSPSQSQIPVLCTWIVVLGLRGKILVARGEYRKFRILCGIPTDSHTELQQLSQGNLDFLNLDPQNSHLSFRIEGCRDFLPWCSQDAFSFVWAWFSPL